ncbi:MAG: zf-HC2 domain-containing protein [Candidatus Poribacteria bacterium]|nr:zf-HC2 domain-containing protein [Candidatus Poribacteria bacterium]
MLNCEDVQSQISAYLDREMPLWKIQLIRLHLKRCSTCAHETMRLQQTHKILGQLDSVRTSNEFLSDVMRRVSTISSVERQRVLPIQRIFRRLESSLTWLRYRFWTRPSSYAVGLSFALIVTIASIATFYQPFKRANLSDSMHLLARSQAQEPFIHVNEIFSVDRFTKPHLNPKHRSIIQTNP